MDTDKLKKMMEMIGEEGDLRRLVSDSELDDNDPADRADKLRQAYKELTMTHSFHEGGLVTWKPGLKNKRQPAEGEPVLITALLEEPLMDGDQNAGSAYYREPLDIRALTLDSDGDAIEFYLDSRRMRPWEG